MSQALGGIRNLLSVYGLSRIVLCLFLGLTIVATGFGLSDMVTSSDSSALKLVETAVLFALAAAAILAMWVALEFAIEGNAGPAATCSFESPPENRQFRFPMVTPTRIELVFSP